MTVSDYLYLASAKLFCLNHSTEFYRRGGEQENIIESFSKKRKWKNAYKKIK